MIIGLLARAAAWLPRYAVFLFMPALAVETPLLPVWSDEFETPGLPDPSRWNWDTGGEGGGNQEAQYYTRARPANAWVDSGYLRLTARREDTLACWYGPCKFTSARLVTRGLAAWTYGKVEVRARLPRGKGLWPAIWMMPLENTYGNWPNSGEIDIMEHVGFEPATVHGTIHTKDYNHLLQTQRGASVLLPDLAEAFHVYGLEWGPDSLFIAVDGRRYFTFARENGSAKWPFDKPFYLLLNIAVGGSWGGQQGVDTAAFPQSMTVDWVRVYPAVPQVGLSAAGPNREPPAWQLEGRNLFIRFSHRQAAWRLTTVAGEVLAEASRLPRSGIRLNLSGHPSGLILLAGLDAQGHGLFAEKIFLP